MIRWKCLKVNSGGKDFWKVYIDSYFSFIIYSKEFLFEAISIKHLIPETNEELRCQMLEKWEN